MDMTSSNASNIQRSDDISKTIEVLHARITFDLLVSGMLKWVNTKRLFSLPTAMIEIAVVP